MAGAGPVFLDALAPALSYVHGALAALLVATSTRHAVEAARLALRGAGHRGLERRLARAVTLLYALTFALGALLYPAYRVHVRAAFLDQHAFSIAELFDVKESYASLALVVALGLAPVSAALEPDAPRALHRVHAAASALVCAVVWFDAIAGLVVVSTRSLA